MQRSALLLAAIAATSCSPQTDSPAGSIALVNARVYTMNADAPEAGAVVVRDDTVGREIRYVLVPRAALRFHALGDVGQPRGSL